MYGQIPAVTDRMLALALAAGASLAGDERAAAEVALTEVRDVRQPQPRPGPAAPGRRHQRPRLVPDTRQLSGRNPVATMRRMLASCGSRSSPWTVSRSPR